MMSGRCTASSKSMLWYSENKFGMALIAKVILVKPGNEAAVGVESMVLAPGIQWE